MSDEEVQMRADVRGWGEGARVPRPEGMVAIAAGDSLCLALGADGRLTYWGANVHGPMQVPADLPPVTSMALGSKHAVALTAEGKVIAWGDDPVDSPLRTARMGLLDVLADLRGARAIAAGPKHSLVLAQ